MPSWTYPPSRQQIQGQLVPHELPPLLQDEREDLLCLLLSVFLLLLLKSGRSRFFNGTVTAQLLLAAQLDLCAPENARLD